MISKSIFVTAGHCGNATSNSRLKFTFNGTDTPVVPENQYAIELSTYKKVYENGVDWAAGRILPNAVTGNYPTSWYSIDTSLPAVGKTVRVTGYGTDNYDNTDIANGGGLNITCRFVNRHISARSQILYQVLFDIMLIPWLVIRVHHSSLKAVARSWQYIPMEGVEDQQHRSMLPNVLHKNS
jgi:hypothetical protein